MEHYDLIVIGGGPAGYTGAIRASQLGMKVACIEKRKTMGGTCLNVGCIPSKALLESSEHYYQAKNKLSKHGVKLGSVELDLPTMQKRKDTIVRQFTAGILGLFKKNKVDGIFGLGRIIRIEGENKIIEVKDEGTTRTLSAKNILLATGSEVSGLPFLPLDSKVVVSSTEALEFTEVPKHLVVIGGGVIGLELGSVWSRLGAKVTVVEFSNKFLSMMDQTTAAELQKALVKQGMEFKLGTKCTGATVGAGSAVVEAEDLASGTKFTLEADKVLVCVGRRPYSDGLGLEEFQIEKDKAGRVLVDGHFQTKINGIYAVGDLIPGPMLAHKAEEEAIAAVEIIAGQKGHVNYEAIPSIIYTWPEYASVGYNEEELKAKGIAYKTGQFPFMANGRARAMEEIEGLAKIISDAKTDRVLGVHSCGPRAGDLIQEAVSVIEFGGSAEDIARTCHAHPTLSEVVKEAALAVDKRTLNL